LEEETGVGTIINVEDSITLGDDIQQTLGLSKRITILEYQLHNNSYLPHSETISSSGTRPRRPSYRCQQAGLPDRAGGFSQVG